jgi:hypothetical protein
MQRRPAPVKRKRSGFLNVVSLAPVRAAGAAITAIAVIVGAMISVDGRYASAADFKVQTQALSQQIEINNLSGDVRFLELRKSTLEDRLYVKMRTPAEQGQRERDKTEYDRIIKQIEDKNRLIDQLRAGTAKR